MSDIPKPPDDASNPQPLDDAELTAYLDGELTEAEAQAVEAKLALDPIARAKAAALKKSFDLLDYLPKPEPSVDFATRTLTKLQPVVSAKSIPAAPIPPASPSTPIPNVAPPAPSGSGINVVPANSASAVNAVAVTFGVPNSGSMTTLDPAHHRSGWLGGIAWLAAAIIAALAGYGAHLAARPYIGSGTRESDELLFSDNQVIRSLPLYLGVDDLNYLKSLNDPTLFAVEPVAKTPVANAPNLASGTAADAMPAVTEKQLADLFKKFSPARQQQLRELDQQFHALPAPEQEQLGHVLENYAVWLDHLADSDRKDLLSAPNSDDRLVKVRLLRNKLWRESLPPPVQRRINDAATNSDELNQVLENLKKADAARREQWNLARRQWESLHGSDNKKPWPFSDPELAKQVDDYIKMVFKADLTAKFEPKSETIRLTREEYNELRIRQEAARKDGEWSLYGLRLYQLAERKPYLPEAGTNGKMVRDQRDLPPLLRKEAVAKGIFERRIGPGSRGKWPEFALELAEDLRKERIKPTIQFGPCAPGEFAEPVNQYLKEKFFPLLDTTQLESLKKLEGKWPEYPKQLIALSRHPTVDIPIPGVTLPGKPSLWVQYYQLPATLK